MSMKGRYPPLNSLLVFLAASRVKSFTRAAETLCVTRSAVSRQIRTLEDYLGRPLFHRDNISLELTPEGMEYANALSLIFSDLNIATSVVMGNSDTAELKVSLSTTFNVEWLMYRFPKFEEENKEINTTFITHNYDTGNESFDFSGNQSGVSIRLGTGQWENCHVDKLLDVNVKLCAAPNLIGDDNFEDIHQLEEYNWLHYGHLPNLWEQWAKSAGVPELKTKQKNIILDNVTVAQRAAIDGLGILPCYECLSDHIIANGTVVPTHDHVMKKPESYYLICPSNYENQWDVKIFRDWLVAEADRYRTLAG